MVGREVTPTDSEKKALISDVASKFEKSCTDSLRARLASLYIVGSYAFGSISLDRPDINFLLIFKDDTTAQDYLEVGRICRGIVDSFADACAIRIQFRPFRYIYPKTKQQYAITLNPITIGTGEIKAMGCLFTKYFTLGIKSANKLLYGKDVLNSLNIGPLTHEDMVKGYVAFDYPFHTLPLSRAPAQYDESEAELLLDEALTEAKDTSYLGVEVAMSDEELRRGEYIKYIQDKERMKKFYAERYDAATAKMVENVIDARQNYLRYKNDQKKAEEIFAAALAIANVVLMRLLTRGGTK